MFSQVPPAVKMVVETLLDQIGLIWASTIPAYLRLTGQGDPEEFRLWSSGGGAEYASEIIWKRVVADESRDWCLVWCSLIRSVDSPEGIYLRWSQYASTLSSAKARTRWMQIADYLGITKLLSDPEYLEMLDFDESDGLSERVFSLRDNDHEFERMTEDNQQRYIQLLLDRGSDRPIEDSLRRDSPLLALLFLCHPQVWVSGGLRTALRGIVAEEFPNTPLGSLAAHLSEQLQRDTRRSIDPWKAAVEELEANFGRSLTTIELSCSAASIVSVTERGGGANCLVGESEFDLPVRYRYARRQAKRPSWWSAQFDVIQDESDAQIWLAGIIVWSAPETLVELLPLVQRAMRMLDSASRERFINSIRRAAIRHARTDIKLEDLAAVLSGGECPIDVLTLIASRASRQLCQAISGEILERGRPQRSSVRVVYPVLLERLADPEEDIEALLPSMSFCIAGLIDSTPHVPMWYEIIFKFEARAYHWEDVVKQARIFPPALVHAALNLEARRMSKARRVASVQKIARDEAWFD